jgi:hypothetical protein
MNITDNTVITAKAAVTPTNTIFLECCMDNMTAIKKVLSPSSEIVISSNPAVKAVNTLFCSCRIFYLCGASNESFCDLTEAHTLFSCELSEGLAFKYFIICHLNQVHHQYVDPDVLVFASCYSPSYVYHRFFVLGCQGLVTESKYPPKSTYI